MPIALNDAGDAVRLQGDQWVPAEKIVNDAGVTLYNDGSAWVGADGKPYQGTERPKLGDGVKRPTTKLGAALDGPGPNLPATPTMDQLGNEWSKVPGRIDDTVRAVANGATFNWADEAAAAANTATGLGPGSTYAENVAAERARDSQINPNLKLAGELTGGLLTGNALARNGVTLLNTAKPTYASLIGRGATEGALYGAAHGAGEGVGLRDTLEKAAYGGAAGAVTGGAMGGVAAKMAQPPKAEIPTTAALKEQSQAAYRAADANNVVIGRDSVDKGIDSILPTRADGYSPKIHKDVAAAVEELSAIKGADQTLGELEIQRRIINSAAASGNADDRRIARIMRDRLDEYVTGLSKADLVSGDEASAGLLSEARGLWSKASKSETIDKLMQRAVTRAQSFTGSGYENAVRNEFKTLSLNEKRMRLFSPAEQDAIRKVAEGGPIGNAARQLGRLAPTNILNWGAGSGVAAGIGYALGGPVGAAVGPAIVSGVGMGGRATATALTNRNARLASEIMRSGGANLPRQLSPAEISLFQNSLIAGSQQAPSLIPFRPMPSFMSMGQ